MLTLDMGPHGLERGCRRLPEARCRVAHQGRRIVDRPSSTSFMKSARRSRSLARAADRRALEVPSEVRGSSRCRRGVSLDVVHYHHLPVDLAELRDRCVQPRRSPVSARFEVQATSGASVRSVHLAEPALLPHPVSGRPTPAMLWSQVPSAASPRNYGAVARSADESLLSEILGEVLVASQPDTSRIPAAHGRRRAPPRRPDPTRRTRAISRRSSFWGQAQRAGRLASCFR